MPLIEATNARDHKRWHASFKQEGLPECHTKAITRSESQGAEKAALR